MINKEMKFLKQKEKRGSTDRQKKGSGGMKPENIILAAAGIIILVLLAAILHIKYMYGIRIHKEAEKIKAEYNRKSKESEVPCLMVLECLWQLYGDIVIYY